MAQDLKDLNLKFEALQEAKRQLQQKNQEQKQKNKEVLAKVKARNEALKQEVDDRQFELGNPQKSELSSLEKELAQQRRKLDDLKAKTTKKQQQLIALKDKSDEVVKQTSGSMGENPATSEDADLKQMRIMENRLDKLMIKLNEAQAMKKTYEVILKKFRDESKENTKQQEQLEKILRSRDHDLQDVIKIAEDAKRAKHESEEDVYNFKPSSRSGKVTKDKSSIDRQPTSSSQQSSNQTPAHLDPELKPVLAYIKEQTGLTNFDEILSKMERHSETVSTLKDLQKSQQAKLMSLINKRDGLKRQVQASGSLALSGAEAQEAYDKAERELNKMEAMNQEITQKLQEEQSVIAQIMYSVSNMSEQLGMNEGTRGNETDHKAEGDHLLTKILKLDAKLQEIC